MYQFTRYLPLAIPNNDLSACNEDHDPVEDLLNLNDHDDEFLE